ARPARDGGTYRRGRGASCEVGGREGEADDDYESEAGEGEVGGAAPCPAAEHAQAEVRAPDDPRRGRHGDERVDPLVAGHEAGESGGDAEREERHRPGDRAQGGRGG